MGFVSPVENLCWNFPFITPILGHYCDYDGDHDGDHHGDHHGGHHGDHHWDYQCEHHLNRRPNYKIRSGACEATLEVELPGVDSCNTSVQVEAWTLIVKGTRYRREPGSCALKVKKEENFVEVKYCLALKLGSIVDKDCVKADSCGDGLLVVKIPFKESVVKKIEIGA